MKLSLDLMSSYSFNDHGVVDLCLTFNKKRFTVLLTEAGVIFKYFSTYDDYEVILHELNWDEALFSDDTICEHIRTDIFYKNRDTVGCSFIITNPDDDLDLWELDLKVDFTKGVLSVHLSRGGDDVCEQDIDLANTSTLYQPYNIFDVDI